MKERNPFLRAALLMLVVAMAANVVFAGTEAFAKYVAQGDGGANARVAKFSFLIGSVKQDMGTSWGIPNSQWDLADKKQADFYWSGSDWAGFWNQMVTPSSISAYPNINTVETITVPLFASEYRGTGGTTVKGQNGALVIAPGVNMNGHTPVTNSAFGNPNTNANGEVQLVFKNNSEVAVRYKVEYDTYSMPYYYYEKPWETATYFSAPWNADQLEAIARANDWTVIGTDGGGNPIYAASAWGPSVNHWYHFDQLYCSDGVTLHSASNNHSLGATEWAYLQQGCNLFGEPCGNRSYEYWAIRYAIQAKGMTNGLPMYRQRVPLIFGAEHSSTALLPMPSPTSDYWPNAQKNYQYFAVSPDPVTPNNPNAATRYIPLTYNDDSALKSPWIVLLPGDEETRSISWTWPFEGQFNGANVPGWSGSTNAPTYPELEGNYFETALGLLGAGKNKDSLGSYFQLDRWKTDNTGWETVTVNTLADNGTNISLKFRITIEQVD